MSNARPAPAVITKLPTVSPRDEATKLTLLVYGQPGVGKTNLAATAADDPRSAPVLFCDVEGGTMSINWRDSGIEVWHWSNVIEDMKTLQAFFGQVGRNGPYKTVVIDSLTDMAFKVLIQLMDLYPDPSRNAEVPNWDDWNRFTSQMMKMIVFLRSLPVHLIVTGLEETVEKKGEVSRIGPLFPGNKIADRLAAYFSQVGRLYGEATDIGEKKPVFQRRLQLQGSPRLVAKDQGDGRSLLAKELVDPTMATLLDRIDNARPVTGASQKGS